MPDIDLDFPDDKREDILAYIVSKYGNQNVAQIVTFGTLERKQVIRDVCKVFGENIITVQKFSNNIAQGKVTLEQTYKENKAFREHVESSERNRKLYQVAKALEGLPSFICPRGRSCVVARCVDQDRSVNETRQRVFGVTSGS